MLKFNFTFSLRPINCRCQPRKFELAGVTPAGSMVHGFSATLTGCERAAKYNDALAYFVAGPAPMDWPKYGFPNFSQPTSDR